MISIKKYAIRPAAVGKNLTPVNRPTRLPGRSSSRTIQRQQDNGDNSNVYVEILIIVLYTLVLFKKARHCCSALLLISAVGQAIRLRNRRIRQYASTER